ncbi:MAG: putative signal transducing protein [Pirellulaceae bacterium]
MISRDPKCVFVANDVARATVVANWLETRGIPARVMDLMTLGGLDGLNAWTGVSARGIEVWVLQPDDVGQALALIEEQEEAQRDRKNQDPASQPVLVFCETCGNTAEFPGEQRDTTQQCPQCRASVIVSERETEDEKSPLCGTPSSRIFALRRLRKPIILFVLGGIALYLCTLLLVALSSLFGGH